MEGRRMEAAVEWSRAWPGWMGARMALEWLRVALEPPKVAWLTLG